MNPLQTYKCPPERTQWRDMGFSIRHKLYGRCYAVDLDFPLLEWTGGAEVRLAALIEYKHESAPMEDFTSGGYKALKLLADGAGIPLFNVRYARDYRWFDVTGLNFHSKVWCAMESNWVMSERRYVQLLWDLRGMGPVPLEILKELND